MSDEVLPRIDITGRYGRLNEGLIDLIQYIPDDKLEWSPREELWDLRHILAHVAFSRHNWMGNFMTQKIKPEDVYDRTATKAGLGEVLRESWTRVLAFASDEASLDRRFEGELEGEKYSYTGHRIYYHLLEHDIHHRADVFHYLALLGVEHPDVETP